MLLKIRNFVTLWLLRMNVKGSTDITRKKISVTRLILYQKQPGDAHLSTTSEYKKRLDPKPKKANIVHRK